MFKRLAKIMTLILAMVMLVSMVAACNTSASTPAATTAEKPKKLVIAYLPNEADEKLVEYRTIFANDLTKAIGIPVEEILATDYNAAIEAMRTGKCDVAFFGPLSFCLAYDRAGAEPLVMTAKDGDRTKAVYQSLLVVKADNTKIKTIADLKGSTFAFVDPNSTSGNLIPSAEFMKAFPALNLTMEDLHTNGKFFKSVTFSGKHQAGLAAVVRGDIDCAPIASDILATELSNGNVKATDFKVIHTSSDIPGSPFAIRSNFDAELKTKIKDFMLSYANESYFERFQGGKTRRFITCSISDYEGIIALNKKLNP